MGRETRRVPAGWVRPKDAEGHHVPLHEGPFSERLAKTPLADSIAAMHWLFDRGDSRKEDVRKLAGDVAAAEVNLAEANAEISRLKSLIDRDRTGLAAGLDECRKRARAGRWISEGRGSYEWDDDRYRKETGVLVNDIVSIADVALRASGALADQAFHTGTTGALRLTGTAESQETSE